MLFRTVREDLFLKRRQRLMDLMTVSVANSLFFLFFFAYLYYGCNGFKYIADAFPKQHCGSMTREVLKFNFQDSYKITQANQLALYYYCFELLQKHQSENSPFGSCIYDFNYIFRAI